MSGPWTATKHANKRPLCPRPGLHVSVSNYTLELNCPKKEKERKKKGKLLQHGWTWDRINLRSVPNTHAKQTFFHKSKPSNKKISDIWAKGVPHLRLKLSVKWCDVSDEGLLDCYQVGVNWELMDWWFRTGPKIVHLPPPSQTLLLNDRQRWWNLDHVGPFFLENTPHDQSHVGMPGVKSGWGMSAIVSASALDICPLRLRGSSSCWRHVLWFTTGKITFKKMLRVSCEQTWWFTSTDDGSEGPPTARMCEGC